MTVTLVVSTNLDTGVLVLFGTFVLSAWQTPKATRGRLMYTLVFRLCLFPILIPPFFSDYTKRTTHRLHSSKGE